MGDLQQVVRALKTLEQVHSELAGIAARTDERRRHDLIELRRQFAQQMNEVGRLADSLFASARDRELEQTYRSLFSRARSTAAAHQANWPAVKLEEAPELYRRSALGVSEAHREFVAWLRGALNRLAEAR